MADTIPFAGSVMPLLDTDIVSALRRPDRHPQVTRWVAAQQPNRREYTQPVREREPRHLIDIAKFGQSLPKSDGNARTRAVEEVRGRLFIGSDAERLGRLRNSIQDHLEQTENGYQFKSARATRQGIIHWKV